MNSAKILNINNARVN